MAHCEKDLRYREPRQEPAIHRRVLRRKPAASISIEQCLILRMVLVRSLQLGVQQWIEHETQDCRYRHQERLRKFFEFQQCDQGQKSHDCGGEIDDRTLTQHDHRTGDRADRGRCDSIDKGLYPCTENRFVLTSIQVLSVERGAQRAR
jgi:hypothetical protein